MSGLARITTIAAALSLLAGSALAQSSDPAWLDKLSA